jgi:hypothetical protein
VARGPSEENRDGLAVQVRCRRRGKQAEKLPIPPGRQASAALVPAIKDPKVCPRFIQLTGTPAAQGVMDLFGQLGMLNNGQSFGRSFTAFAEKYYHVKPLPNGGNIYTPKKGSLEAAMLACKRHCI